MACPWNTVGVIGWCHEEQSENVANLLTVILRLRTRELQQRLLHREPRRMPSECSKENRGGIKSPFGVL